MVDINKLLKQAQGMQQQMNELQSKMANKEYIGKSGGGLVVAIINGAGEMGKITIDPSLLKESEKDMLEDLIIAAFNDAKKKLDDDSKDSMSNIFGNMPMPPNMKLPF